MPLTVVLVKALWLWLVWRRFSGNDWAYPLQELHTVDVTVQQTVRLTWETGWVAKVSASSPEKWQVSLNQWGRAVFPKWDVKGEEGLPIKLKKSNTGQTKFNSVPDYELPETFNMQMCRSSEQRTEQHCHVPLIWPEPYLPGTIWLSCCESLRV